MKGSIFDTSNFSRAVGSMEGEVTWAVGRMEGEVTSLRTVLDFATNTPVICRESKKTNKLHTCLCSKTRDHIPEDHYCGYCGKVYR